MPPLLEFTISRFCNLHHQMTLKVTRGCTTPLVLGGTTSMRMMMRVSMPVENGNTAVREGRLGRSSSGSSKPSSRRPLLLRGEWERTGYVFSIGLLRTAVRSRAVVPCLQCESDSPSGDERGRPLTSRPSIDRAVKVFGKAARGLARSHFQEINRAAASRRAASARNFLHIRGEVVIDRQLLAFRDVPFRVVNNVSLTDARYQVRFA